MQIKIYNSRKLNETREFNLALATSNLKGECFIGRSPASGLVLDSADISRLHGKFFQQSGNYYFIDIGSRNGSIINGKLAEIKQVYPLKPGDIVRIGEFVLILEEMDVLRQDLAETVFGSADTNTTAIKEITDNKSLSAASTDEIFIPTAEIAETYIPVTVVVEDINEISAAILVDNTLIQAENSAIAADEETFIQSPQPLTDATFIQPPVIDLNIETAIFTAQPPTELEIFTSSDTLTEAETIPIGDRPTHIEVSDRITQFSEDLEFCTTEPEKNIVLPVTPTTKAPELEALPNSLNLFELGVTWNVENDTITSNCEETEIEDTFIQAAHTELDIFSQEEIAISVTDSSDLFTYEELDQLSISNKREVDPILDLDPWQDLESESEIVRALTHNLAVVEEKATATNTTPTIADGKYIALMAHDRQKTELTNFVAQHQAFFHQYLTIATPTTSASLQKTGLEVAAETPALPIGGYQAIANLVNSGNILAVILLKDVLELPQLEQENEAALMRSCHLNQVLLATNLATAEAILCYLKNGNG